MILCAVVLGITATAGALTRVIETKKTNVLAQQAWYDVSGTSDAPSALQVTSGPKASPTNSPSCNMDNEGNPCGAHLSFPNNDAPTSIPAGTTVQDLIDNYGASIVLDDDNNPEFTRQEQN
ncbi:hypothetical protein GCM10011418_47050 [Sphingobacterium alkalisoli]|nr:hypothetical protein GCM10011418_47050 [Sphingobacterium alkalisoli]